jgi:polyferredoxin
MEKKNPLIKIVVVAIAVVIFLMILSGQQYLQFMLTPKYLFFLLTAIAAITLLAMGKVSNLVRIITLIIFFAIFGVFIGIHPSPLCALTKSLTIYKMSAFLPPPMIVMAAAMILFTIVGNKVFCGWICPLGCLQEITFKLSRPIKKFKLPFFISNSVRFSLFALFLIYLSLFGTNIYNLFNPFELFHWHLNTYLIIVTTVVILASLIYYRPFCHFLCPAGLITWFFEQVSIFKVIKNESRCTHCNKCIKESPCSAIDPIIKDHTIIPDCYACGKCIESCQVDALSFSLK